MLQTLETIFGLSSHWTTWPLPWWLLGRFEVLERGLFAHLQSSMPAKWDKTQAQQICTNDFDSMLQHILLITGDSDPCLAACWISIAPPRASREKQGKQTYNESKALWYMWACFNCFQPKFEQVWFKVIGPCHAAMCQCTPSNRGTSLQRQLHTLGGWVVASTIRGSKSTWAYLFRTQKCTAPQNQLVFLKWWTTSPQNTSRSINMRKTSACIWQPSCKLHK